MQVNWSASPREIEVHDGNETVLSTRRLDELVARGHVAEALLGQAALIESLSLVALSGLQSTREHPNWDNFKNGTITLGGLKRMLVDHGGLLSQHGASLLEDYVDVRNRLTHHLLDGQRPSMDELRSMFESGRQLVDALLDIQDVVMKTISERTAEPGARGE